MYQIIYLNKISRFIYHYLTTFFYLLIILFITSGCINKEKQEGVVATVNGEIITLRSIESLLNSKFTPILMFKNSSLNTTKNYYGDALGTLIIHALIRQDLEKRGISVRNDILENEVLVIKNDFHPQSIEKYFDEAVIDENDWKELTKDHIELLVFMERVLLPQVKVQTNEVSNYFKTHQKEFVIPECQEITYLSAPQKSILEQFCNNLEKIKSVNTLQDKNILMQSFYVPSKEFDKHENNNFKGSKPGGCGKLFEEKGSWQTTIISNKIASRQLELPEVYSMIEEILIKQKLNNEFEKWLQNVLYNSKILVSPNLKNALLSSDMSKNIPDQDTSFNELENSIWK